MKKTIGRNLPNGDYIEITAEVRENHPELSDGFAITASIWERHGTHTGRARARRGRESDMGGQCHDQIREAAPELEPLIVAHLSNLDGTPMHAKANGWYFYSGAHIDYERKNYGDDYIARHGTPHERAARSLNIPPADLPEGLSQDEFNAFCDQLAGRWAAQADAARAAFAAMDDGDGIER